MTSKKIIGIVGGGQLGRMLIQSGINYDLEFHVLTQYNRGSNERFPSRDLCRSYTTTKSLNDYNTVLEFGMNCDIITIEIENCNVDALAELKEKHDKIVIPDPEIIRMVQSKVDQKDFLVRNNLPTAEYLVYHHVQDLINLLETETENFKFPCINKLDRGGYDGRGVQIIHDEEELKNRAFQVSEEGNQAFLEEKIDFDKELGITVARNRYGQIILSPICEMMFNDQNMLNYLLAPAVGLSRNDIVNIKNIATKLSTELNLIGIMSIELFWKEGQQVWVNELSPRPHNSAHYTMDGCTISQYDLLIHCLLDLPLPECELLYPFCSTINLLGHFEVNPEGSSNFEYQGIRELQEYCQSGVEKNNTNHLMAFVHLYGKSRVTPYRKMGHINLINNNSDGILNCIELFKYQLCCYESNIVDNDMVVVNNDMMVIKNDKMVGNQKNNKEDYPLISVIMGSKSDLPVMKGAMDMIEKFGISYEVNVVSAHRTPKMMISYADSARDRGIRVIIAGAGGAAHLPGMVAAVTTLPVIGVPIKSSNSIDGWDSVLSILQMPSGVPVATVALNGAKNAGILACQIIGSGSQEANSEMIRLQMDQYKRELEDKVYTMNKELDEE